MAGLRDKQKEQRERRILDEATKLIRQHGPDISIDDIAAHAEVGVATVYNYFHSKSELVLAVMQKETRRTLNLGQSILDNPPDDPNEAVSALLVTYFGELCQCFDKAIFRELMLSLLHADLATMDDAIQMDYSLMEQLTALLEKLRARGDIAGDIAPIEAAQVLYGMAGSELIMYLHRDEATPENLAASIRDRTRLIFRGLSPR